MSHRRTLVVAVAAAVVIAVVVGGAVGLGLSGDPDKSPAATSGSSGAGDPNAPAGSPSASPANRPGTKSQGSESLPDPSTSAVPFTPVTSAAPTVKGGVTVMAEVPGAAPSTLPGLGTQRTTPLPTWEDLPSRSVFARGRLVAGYPARLLPPAPDGSVVSSSVSPSKDRVQVALVGVRGRNRDRVLRFYRAELARAGFKETAVAAVGESDAAAFNRGASRVVVTLDSADDKTYSVFATLVIGKA